MRILIILMIFVLGVSLNSNTVESEPRVLSEVIEEALANNPRLKAGDAHREGINAGAWDEILPHNPELFAEIEGVPEGKGPDSYGERSIGITQEVDFPAMYMYRARRQNEVYRQASASYLETRQQVVAEVTEAFYRTLWTRELLVLQDEIVQYTKTLYDHALTKAEAGEVTRYEPLRAQVELSEAQAYLHELERSLTFDRYSLKLLMGKSKSDSLEITGTLEVTPVQIDADSLKAIAMENHPVLRESLARIEQRRIEHRMAKASSLPGLSFSWFHQQYEEDGGRSAWGGNVSLTLPLWDIAKAPGRIKAAGLAVETAGWELEVRKRTILASIEEAVKKLTVAGDQVTQYQDTILTEVTELVRITERSYAEGELGSLEMVESLRTMQRARSAYLTALYTYHAALADLQAVIGSEMAQLHIQ